MVNRCVGGVGDFAKYGLLRAITGEKLLGVVCYLNPTAGAGRQPAYLPQESWRRLDPELFDTMKRLVDGDNRSLFAMQLSGNLGDAVHADADDPLEIGLIRVSDHKAWRNNWFARVKERLSACDLLFADPSSGLVADRQFRTARQESAKQMPYAEAKSLTEGRRAVISHHRERNRSGHRQEIRAWMDRLPGCTHAWHWQR